MNMPGFAAEASLYMPTGRYLMGGSSSDVPNLEVVLALAPWFHSREWWNCAANCVKDCLSDAADPFHIKESFGFEAANCSSYCETHCDRLYDWLVARVG